MKKYTTQYYFLFLLLITGAFASMDQQAYGLVLSGIACLGFALTLLYENFSGTPLTEESSRVWVSRVELITLSGVAVLFMLRNFLVDFYFSNQLMSVLLLILLGLTVYNAITNLRSASFRLSLAFYYSAIIAFILSVIAGAQLPGMEKMLAVTGVGFLLLFVTSALASHGIVVKEESITAWSYLRNVRNKSSLVLTTGALLAVFYLLVSTRSLPPLYRADMPEGYQHLVDRISTEEDAKKAQQFKDRFDAFVKKRKP